MENMRINSIEAFKALVELGRMIINEKGNEMPADHIIAVTAVLPMWEEGTHTVNSIVRYAGQPWRCLQSHDSTGNVTWCPGAAPSLWGPYHATTAESALPWQAPTGAHDCYNKGEYMIWTDKKVYRSTTDGNVYSPEVCPNGWADMNDRISLESV